MNRKQTIIRSIAGVTSAVVVGTAIASGAVSPVQAATPRASVSLLGAGSTFVQPLMQTKWIVNYQSKNASVSINYNGTGSGAGITLWTQKATDFAASDALLNTTQEAAATASCNSTVTKVPVTIGAVALIYNLPGVKTGLKLNADVVGRIFTGAIHEWSDLRIAKLNPGVKLPQRPIYVVYRSDGSGTTYITTNYLAQVSPAWTALVPKPASTVKWPTGTGAKGSSGVATAVSRTPGAISYVDLAYAINQKLSYASLQNKSGLYVVPSSQSASLAAQSFASTLPKDLQQVIVNSSDSGAYPISGYSYMFLCSTQSGDKGKALVDFAKYVVTTGQSFSASLYYAPLPKNVQAKDLAALAAITVK